MRFKNFHLYNLPIVGIVAYTSPNFSLNKTVVFPDESSPNMRIRTLCLLLNLENKFANILPIVDNPKYVIASKILTMCLKM